MKNHLNISLCITIYIIIYSCIEYAYTYNTRAYTRKTRGPIVDLVGHARTFAWVRPNARQRNPPDDDDLFFLKRRQTRWNRRRHLWSVGSDRII